ncbi:MAG: 8-amino-7-oxononanoate synthase [Muribaculaceae bacterium]|nr:8-amino-7-oxononanoate synthase [Muribaculaceae bacterium]
MDSGADRYYSDVLESLAAGGNLRSIPADRQGRGVIDLSTNDYLGYGSLTLSDFADSHPELLSTLMTSSASRLLASAQREYEGLEHTLETLYPGKRVLLFNSGYHANAGILGAVADRSSIVLADKLVHASIIDGIMLSRAKMIRFAHNDFSELRRLLTQYHPTGKIIWVVVESVYSMDGDSADIEALIELKREFPGIHLYVDEAHAFGVCGSHGAGFVAQTQHPEMVDVTVATLGKALASYGAFAVVSPRLREFLLNRARSFIFSTSLSPLQVRWSQLMVERMADDDVARARLQQLATQLSDILGEFGQTPVASHIQPLMIGDARRAVELSARLAEHDIIVLPIRTPTVPAGTERLRFSLNAAIKPEQLDYLKTVLKQCVGN